MKMAKFKITIPMALMIIIFIAGAAVGGWIGYNWNGGSATATYESQQRAETPQGVREAANNAQVPLSVSQETRVAQAVRESVNEPPAAVVTTTGSKLQETIKSELQKSGGRFSIITDPAHPANVPVAAPSAAGSAGKTTPATAAGAATVTAIPPNATVTLNQYNIKAYPDRLIQIGGSYQEVLAAYSWRVTVPKIPIIAPRGDVGYLGLYGHANFDQPGASRVGILLTIPK